MGGRGFAIAKEPHPGAPARQRLFGLIR